MAPQGTWSCGGWGSRPVSHTGIEMCGEGQRQQAQEGPRELPEDTQSRLLGDTAWAREHWMCLAGRSGARGSLWGEGVTTAAWPQAGG